MSEIRATTISDAAGTGPIALTGQSAAKAWLKSTYSSGTPTVQNSLNISSLGDTSTGQIDVNLTNSMSSSTNYAVCGASDGTLSGANARTNFSSQDLTASDFTARLYAVYVADNYVDGQCHLNVSGDLA